MTIDLTSTGNSAPSFEEALEQLQAIVTRLEAGGATLEETIGDFRQGTELASYCQRLIADAELRITELSAPAKSTTD
jgi:exodeoxyribonuclease VII small subunit